MSSIVMALRLRRGSQQSGLVDEVLEVSARKACGALCDDLEGDIRGEGLVLGVDFQDLLAALDVGQADVDLTVEAARAEQGLIEDVGTVGGCHDDDAIVGLEAVHLDQQLVQGLLALIVTAAETCAALTAYRVDLIDEDDGRHRLFGFFKQVAHTGGTDADVHLDEIGTGNRVERHTGLTGTGAGQQRFAGTRRADKQYAVRNACAEGVELVRGLQELNDLLQLGLFLTAPATSAKVALRWFSC